MLLAQWWVIHERQFDWPDGFIFSVENLCAHIDLLTSHDYHGPIWVTVCTTSLLNARDFILITHLCSVHYSHGFL